MDSTLRFPDLPDAGAVVELDDSHLDGLQWKITSKSVSRKRGLTTVVYTLWLLRPVQRAALSVPSLLPGTPLVATQLPPHRDMSCPLTVTSVDIGVISPTSVCQVELSAVTCWSDGCFHAPLPEEDTEKPSIVIRTRIGYS